MASFSDTNTYPKDGQKIRTLDLKPILGIKVGSQYVNNRSAHNTGTVITYVPGYGGDVYFVEHLKGCVAVYTIMEMEPN